jgi:hypothetical protein
LLADLVPGYVSEYQLDYFMVIMLAELGHVYVGLAQVLTLVAPADLKIKTVLWNLFEKFAT